MDPITGIGAAAAISQLAVQLATVAVTVVDLYFRMKDAPEIARKQLLHFEHLEVIARAIVQNKALQTDAIQKCLKSCLQIMSKVEQKARKVTDSKLKRLAAVIGEDKMVKLFDELERGKSSLLLCIENIDVALLHTLNSTIATLQGSVQHMSNEVHDSALQIVTTFNVVKDVDSKLLTVERELHTMVDAIPANSTALEDIKNEIHAVSEQLRNLALSNAQSRPPLSLPVQKYCMVPNRRTKNFVGRKDVLPKIDDIRCSSHADVPLVVIRGMGGQGKTQIALQYCFDKRDKPFSATFWLDATTATTLTNSFENVYAMVKSVGSVHGTSDEKVQYVLHWLAERDTPWLLIFDNHDKLDFRLKDYFPYMGLGFLIVTTRSAAMEDIVTDGDLYLDLQVLDNKSALELFLRTSAKNSIDERSKSLALDIVTRLGNHALAVVQAGSYIKKRKLDFARFLNNFEMQKRKILETTLSETEYRRRFHGVESDKETELNVFTTWELSFQQLVKETSEDSIQVKLLTLLAYFDNQDISEGLFTHFDFALTRMHPASMELLEWLGYFKDDDEWNTDRFREILDAFTNVSLVQSWDEQEDGFAHATIHPLVRDWIRIRTSVEQNMRNEVIVWHLLGATAECYVKRVTHTSGLKIHIPRSINKHPLEAVNKSLNPECTRVMDFDLAISQSMICKILHFVNTDLEVQELLCERVISILGLESVWVREEVCTLITILRALKKYTKLEQFLNQALEVRKNSPGISIEEILELEFAWGKYLSDLGKFDEADPCIRDVLARIETSNLPKSFIGEMYFEYGCTLHARKDFANAEIMKRRAWDLVELIDGSEGGLWLLPVYKGQLGLTLGHLNRYEEAIGMLDEAIEKLVRDLSDETFFKIFTSERISFLEKLERENNVSQEEMEDQVPKAGQEIAQS